MGTRIAIVTDSTSDIPQDIAQERQIYVAPIQIIWGKDHLRDGIDISRPAFYERLKVDRQLPTTSQPSPAEFANTLQKARDETDAEKVIALTISSDLSGTYSSAQQAVGMVDFPVELIDSRTTSGALGLAALAVADWRDQQIPLDELVQKAHTLAHRTRAVLTINTLEFLHRSGRVSAARRWIGTALQIKPILHVNDGRMEPLETVRTRTRALNRMMDIFTGWIDRSQPVYTAILYGDTPEDADVYEEKLRRQVNPAFLMKTIASSAVGVHTGPGAMGLTLLQ